jgi:hypothetical protein
LLCSGIEIGTQFVESTEVNAMMRTTINKHSACQLSKNVTIVPRQGLKSGINNFLNYCYLDIYCDMIIFSKIKKGAHRAPFSMFLITNIAQPGGHAIERPPSTWTCR